MPTVPSCPAENNLCTVDAKCHLATPGVCNIGPVHTSIVTLDHQNTHKKAFLNRLQLHTNGLGTFGLFAVSVLCVNNPAPFGRHLQIPPWFGDLSVDAAVLSTASYLKLFP